MTSISKIISGGQTGADRSGLDAAICLGIEHGGFCPKGRLSEDGDISTRYALTELKSRSYSDRTKANVLAADATLIFFPTKPGRGGRLTIKLCEMSNKPYCCVDVTQCLSVCVAHVSSFLSKVRPSVVNIAGTRESKHPGISDLVYNILVKVLED